MEIVACQHCGENTPSEYNFCVECEQQIRCLDSSCGKLVIPGKDMCFGCGKPLMIKLVANQAPNKFVRKVRQNGDKYEEHTELTVSDKAVDALAPLFSTGQFNPVQRGQQVDINKKRVISNNQPNLFNQPPALPQKEEEENEGESVASVTPDSSNSDGKESGNKKSIFADFFVRDGDILVPRQRDFKGTTWAQQQLNFIVIYAQAYNDIVGKPIPERKHFNEAASKAKIADTHNFTTYVTRAIGHWMQEITEGLILTVDGEKEVRRIVKLMTDENSPQGYDYWDRQSTTIKRSRLTSEDENRVKSWLADEVDLGQLDIRDASSAKDYALIAFWIINNHLKKAESIKWNEASLYLTSKYNTISVTGQAFRAAVVSNQQFFNFNNSSDTYYITSAGEKIVEDWVEGVTKIKSDK